MEKKILVIGDSCIDSYAYCRSTRLAPDKPVPVLEVLDTVNTPGMAYNVFRNVVSLTKFPKGIDLLTNERYEDVVKTRYVDAFSNHMFMRVDSIVNIDRIKDNNIRDGYDTVIISDYDKGFLTAEDIERGPSDNEIQSKFYRLSERVMTNEKARALFEASMDLESMPKISTLVDLTEL